MLECQDQVDHEICDADGDHDRICRLIDQHMGFWLLCGVGETITPDPDLSRSDIT